jgi:lipopolysaccharide transport system permease protein
MSDEHTQTARPFLHIKPKKGWQVLNLRELKEYKDLLYFLVLRDIKVKYKQTVLGGLWAIIQPFCSMVLFSLFFGTVAKIPSGGVPYPVFSYSALVAWTYFAHSLSGSGTSLNEHGSFLCRSFLLQISGTVFRRYPVTERFANPFNLNQKMNAGYCSYY